MTIGYDQFLDMLEAHPKANSASDLIAAYPNIPPEDIQMAWESFQQFMRQFREVYGPIFVERYGSDIERARELKESLAIPENTLKKISLAKMVENRERMEAMEIDLSIMLSSAPIQEKRGPGRPTTPHRIDAYNFIRSERMTQKQAFDWWLAQESIKIANEDDYSTQFKSFKNAYRSWKSRTGRKNG